MMNIFKASISKKSVNFAHFCLILLLFILIIIGVVPGYFSGEWAWQDLPRISNISYLIKLKKTELAIPGWTILQQQEVIISNNQWSLQIMSQDSSTPVTLLMMPQDFYKKKPEVEWTNLQLLGNWQTSEHKTIKFASENPQEKSDHVKAHFFRSSMPPIWQSLRVGTRGRQENNQTFAVVQWYAWPGGGSFVPSDWFWRDQFAQLNQDRLPWVAVSLQIPISPLSDLKEMEEEATKLAKLVQTSLEEQVFAPMSSNN